MNETTEAEVIDVPTESDAEEATNPVASLTLQDITLAANIIDLAVQRGAFKGAEAGTVGACFNKLAALVQAVNSANQAQAEATTEEETSTEEDTSEE